MVTKLPKDIIQTINNAGMNKAKMSFEKTLVMGFLAVASEDAAGKILGIWFPIMAFVTLGFEHSVANMFFIPLGIFYSADVTWTQFFVVNLIRVTLGNIVGGSFFVGTIYWYVYEYEKPGKVEKSFT
jgi:formate/nitrite transporter FocA (FNT family)